MGLYHKILVPVDDSDLTDDVLETALATAAWSDADVILLSVGNDITEVDNSAEVVDNDLDVLEADIKALKATAEAAAARHGVSMDRVTAEIRGGGVVETLVHAVDDLHIDLVVMGTHGRKGILEEFTGSTTEQVMRKMGATLFVVRPKGFPYLRD